MSDIRRYRDRNTGLVASYPAALGKVFPYLEEVDEDAKKLINPPVSEAAVEGHVAHHESKASKAKDQSAKVEE